jgi:hypothetical protein
VRPHPGKVSGCLLLSVLGITRSEKEFFLGTRAFKIRLGQPQYIQELPSQSSSITLFDPIVFSFLYYYLALRPAPLGCLVTFQVFSVMNYWIFVDLHQ